MKKDSLPNFKRRFSNIIKEISDNLEILSFNYQISESDSAFADI